MIIFFCNVTWMEEYRGREDGMKTGGSWVKKHNDGLEKYNFYDMNGEYRGYVATQGHQIRIERLGVKEGEEFVDNILVVWVAKDTENNTNKIVGWYKNARVYRNYQKIDGRTFNIIGKVDNCVLLPIDKRIKEVPRANVVGKSKGMGQSNYWYADSPKANDYVKEVEEYIDNYNEEQLNNKKPSSVKLKEKGFDFNNTVIIKDGVLLQEYDNLPLGGWKGKIYKTTLTLDDELLVWLKLSEKTIKNMPDDYIKDSKSKGLDYKRLFIKVKDIKLEFKK